MRWPLLVFSLMPTVQAGCGCGEPACTPGINLCKCFDDDNFFVCFYDQCCFDLDGRRLSDKGGRILPSNDKGGSEDQHGEYHELEEMCGRVEYEARLHVDGHLYGVAAPTERTSTCPMIAIHAEYEQDGYVKKLLVWDDAVEGDAAFDSAKSMSVGAYALNTLFDAYQAVDLRHQVGRPYDIIHNNCAEVVLQMGGHLGIQPDRKLVSFVGRQLAQAMGSEIAHKIRQQKIKYLGFLWQGGTRRLQSRDPSDEALVQAFVESHFERLR